MSEVIAAPTTGSAIEALFPARYRSLITLMGLAIIGSLISSVWLLPSRLERVAVAVEQGAPDLVRQELDRATREAADPGEARALVDVALTIGSPELAASILQRLLLVRPDSVEGLRLLLEVQRQRHLPRDVAALDEHVYALTGDAEALRDAADIYASRRMSAERIDALRRLNAIGRASAADMAELTHRVADAGDLAGALDTLMAWLDQPRGDPLSVVLLGQAAGLSANMQDARAIATRLGSLIGHSGQIGPLHVLVQTYAERAHPELSLVAGYALGDEMTARPDVAVVLAQLEAVQGKLAAARARLDKLARAGTLLPTASPMLAELTLQAGDLQRAVSIVASFAPNQIVESLPHRLVDAADAAGRRDLLIGLPVELFTASSPASAASVALAHGDRERAITLVREALAAGADTEELGPAFGHAVQALGLQREVIAHLLFSAQTHELGDEPLSLLIQLAETTRINLAPLLDALLRQRDSNLRAGVLWSMLAARSGQSEAVASWLKTSSRLPSQALIDLLTLAVERRASALAQMSAIALMRRPDLPAGWTADEIMLFLHSNEPLSKARFRTALDLIGDARTDPTAKERVTALLTGAPAFAQLATKFSLDAHDPAIVWLTAAVVAGGNRAEDGERLRLLTGIAPDQAASLLSTRVASDRQHLAPLYIAALTRTGQSDKAQAELRALLRDETAAQQDATLQETLAWLSPSEALPVYRVAAAVVGRADWIDAFDEALLKAGLTDELRATLRHRGIEARGDSKRLQALASRLLDLHDRKSAADLLLVAAAGKGPNAPEVEQLMYVWGPRADPEAVAWTSDRALAAPLAELPKWIDDLAYLGDPRAVISVVDRRPEVLAHDAGSVRAFGSALVAANVKSTPDLQGAIVSASKSDDLNALAQLAIDTRQPTFAWQAARASLVALPGNKEALLLAAQAASALRRSANAASLYLQLLSTGSQTPEINVDAGDALITAKRVREGREVLQVALGGLSAKPPTLASSRVKARALSLLGRRDEAKALLNSWLERFPNQAGLKADLLQLELASQL